jgi:hypothetical protein
MKEEYDSLDIFIEDVFSSSFVLGLGVKRPNENVIENFIAWVKIQGPEEMLTEDFIRDLIPTYINFLYLR